MLVKLFIASSLLFCLSASAGAQVIPGDTMSPAVYSVIQQYKARQGDNLLLYNGIEYARTYPHTTGTPFLLSDSFSTGSVMYDGVVYQNVPLNYDVVSNRVVIKNKDNFLIELVNEKINSFLVDDRQFVSLSEADIPKAAMPPGIYEVYNYLPVAVFILHRKAVQSAYNAADLDHFTEYNETYVQKGSEIIHIKNNKDLLNAFGDQQKAVSSYMKQNHLSYKRHPEEAVVKAAAYYAQLKK